MGDSSQIDDREVGDQACDDVVVIGGGIAGLTAAFRLHRAGLKVRVVEATAGPGGVISSVEVDGHVFERGPTTVLSTAPRLGSLIDDAGLRPRVIESRPLAGRRLVWRHGRLHALPEKPPHLLRCTALSPLGRLRLLLEPLVPARLGHDDETLGGFFRRRLGREATAGLADPFVTGVFAGQLDALGVDAFPRLAQLEKEHGSLAKGLILAQRARKRSLQEGRLEGSPIEGDATQGEAAPARTGPPPLLTFEAGLCALPRHLAEILGERICFDTAAVGLAQLDQGWQVRASRPDGSELVYPSRGVVLATPSRPAAELLRPVLGLGCPEVSHSQASGSEVDAGAAGPSDALQFLDQLPHPHVATVGLGYRRSDIAHPLDAFGLLVASDSRLEHDVLGVLFVSSIFPGRAPDGEVTLTVMLGGSRDPSVGEMYLAHPGQEGDALLAERAHKALTSLVGARGEPTAVCVSHWPRAIPQYPPGHGGRIRALQRCLDPHGGLAIAGNWLDGVGLESAVASGDRAAERILGSLESPTSTHPSPT